MKTTILWFALWGLIGCGVDQGGVEQPDGPLNPAEEGADPRLDAAPATTSPSTEAPDDPAPPFAPERPPECGGPCLARDLGCPLPGEKICTDGTPVCAPIGGGLRGDGRDGELHVTSGEVVVLRRHRYDFTRIHVEAGGRIEARPALVGGQPIVIRVLGEVAIDEGGVIELSGRGWPGGPRTEFVERDYADAWTNNGGATGAHGFGPTGGGGGWAAPQELVGSGGGGGHASAGEDGTRCTPDSRGFAVWDVNSDAPHAVIEPPAEFSMGGDSTDAPLAMGSGGGAGANNFDGGPLGYGGAGGAGGGALRITAVRIRVDGEILADGAPGEDGEGFYVGAGGGGAGGTIHLIAVAIEIDGLLSALGGAGGVGSTGLGWTQTVGGAGGAGRIRLAAPVVDVTGTVEPSFEEGVNACEGGPGAHE